MRNDFKGVLLNNVHGIDIWIPEMNMYYTMHASRVATSDK